MLEMLRGLSSLPQKQLIRKYYFPYQSDEADHSADPTARPAARHWRIADVEQ
jgi:hypothetical protein